MVILKRPTPKQQQLQPQQACPFAGEHVRLPLMPAQVGRDAFSWYIYVCVYICIYVCMCVYVWVWVRLLGWGNGLAKRQSQRQIGPTNPKAPSPNRDPNPRPRPNPPTNPSISTPTPDPTERRDSDHRMPPSNPTINPTPQQNNQNPNTQASYFCRRKFLLVNGTHTTLAFMTLCLRQPRKAPNEVGHGWVWAWWCTGSSFGLMRRFGPASLHHPITPSFHPLPPTPTQSPNPNHTTR